jgi:flagellar hook-associated protein 1
MSKISAMMDTGKRSMMNSQTALQTVGHNIANKTTEGYSRQRVELQTNGAVGVGNLRIGTGAKAAMVTRTNNPYLERQIQKEGATQGYLTSRAEGLSRVEQVYNEQASKGLNQYVTDFFNSWRELSNTPESLTTRTMVQESAQALVKDFRRVHDQLNSIQEDLDGQVVSNVEEINQYTKEIAQLNEKIQIVELQGIPANDERDRRELLLKKLNEKIDISYGEGTDGQVTVTAGRSALLVSGYSSSELKTYRTPERNRMEIYFSATAEGTPQKVTDQIKGGSLGGALDVRDVIIEDLHNTNDEMAYSLSMEVNKAHIEGFDRTGNSGVLFFDILNGVEGSAGAIRVNETILNDVGRISAGAKGAAPGDNTVANVISGIQYKNVMDDGTATVDDYYNSQVGRIGVLAQRAIKSNEAQKNVLAQLNNIRESISGVSLDEETTKLIEFQKSFDASARLIKAADEMFDTVLSIKRM